MKWKILDTEYLIRRPWLTARRDKVKLPDGRIIDEYYVLEYPTWINVIALTADGQMVFVRQYRHALGVTRLELTAGVVEQGETPLHAAQRELQEETGYGGGQWREFLVTAPNPGVMTNLTHTFLAEGVTRISTQHLDPTEDLEVHLCSPHEALTMLQQGEFLQALMVAPLWKFFAERKMV